MSSTPTAEPRVNAPDKAAASTPGPVLAIGGAEDKFRDRIILSSFFQLAGGRNARIAIVPTASSIEAAGERYKAIFLEMGAADASVLFIGSREDANGESHIETISEATGIFMTGGNQMRLSALVSGTKVAQAIKQRHEAGMIVAGTSAGASILSSHMVAYGASGATPRMRMAQMIAGFGLVPELIIDQHFRQRDRIGRLLSLVASNPGLIGVGIDEDTAALIDGQNVLEVVGRHSITIVDGQDMYSDIFQVKGHEGITLSGARLHVLTPGRRFDMTNRRLLDV
jgi:cyanophycinase